MQITIGIQASLAYDFHGEDADARQNALVEGWGAYMQAQLAAVGGAYCNEVEATGDDEDAVYVRMWCRFTGAQLAKFAKQIYALGNPVLLDVSGIATEGQIKLLQIVSKPYDAQAASDCYQDGENVVYSSVFVSAEHMETIGATLAAIGV